MELYGIVKYIVVIHFTVVLMLLFLVIIMSNPVEMPILHENEKAVTIHSVKSEKRGFFRIVNRTRRKVDVYWVDYNGNLQKYGVILQNQGFVINSFVTHPWVALDSLTRERYLLNCSLVYYCKEYKDQSLSLEHHPPLANRDIVCVTTPVFSLLHMCARVIKNCLEKDDHAYLLHIPSSLQKTIALMLPRKS